MADTFEAITTHLRRITSPDEPERYLSAGVARRDEVGERHFMTGPEPAALPRVRVASISKMVTALTVAALEIDEAMPVRDVLGIGDPRITVGQLLIHTSGLTDQGGYIFDPPEGALARLHHPVREPGTYFHYCNLGYVLLGNIVETVTGERFDSLTRRLVLEPAGVAGGFNWAGVPVAERENRLPLYRRSGTEYTLEVDSDTAAWDAELIWAGGEGRDLSDHRIGLDATYFSPHAGLRANALDLARLAWFLGTTTVGQRVMEQRWVFDGQNGRTGGGLFLRYGAGVSIYGDDPRLPQRLAGHAGHALGFSGGAWFNRETGNAWGYMLTGAADETEGHDDEVFFAPREASIIGAF